MNKHTNPVMKNIPSNIQNEYYGSILKMSTEQKELEALIVQYKNTYEEFISASNNINKSTQWVVERNVWSMWGGNYIPEIYATDISQNQCILECLNDPKCNYILFSDSGNGECAANQCLKFTNQVTNQETKFEKIPFNFDLPNPGCEITKNGPLQSLFTFNGWKKPTWFNFDNTSLITKHSLGKANSLDECKQMALSSQNNGPYSYIQYDEQKQDQNTPISSNSNQSNCYYATEIKNNVYINKLNPEMTSTVSVASLNEANNMKTLQQLVERLNQLNAAIANQLYKVEKHEKYINKKNVDYQNKLTTQFNYSNAYEKLNNDRKVLQQLYDYNKTHDELNSNIKKNLNMKKSRYWFLEFLI